MKKLKLQTAFLALFLSICLLLPACKQKQANEPVEKDETGIVVPGQGMDGVKLGDIQDIVIAKLGKPSGSGYLDGIFRSWRALNYQEGLHAGLFFYFLEEPDGSFGILDGISASSQYSGKTKEGIGIGSTIIKVHEAYGIPVHSLNNNELNMIFEFYCIEQKKLEIHYKDSLISGFSIGYYKPMPEDPNYPCR